MTCCLQVAEARREYASLKRLNAYHPDAEPLPEMSCADQKAQAAAEQLS